jgi:hypothetical protein
VGCFRGLFGDLPGLSTSLACKECPAGRWRDTESLSSSDD